MKVRIISIFVAFASLGLFAAENHSWVKFSFEVKPFKTLGNIVNQDVESVGNSWLDNIKLKAEEELDFDSLMYASETLLLCGYSFASWLDVYVGHRLVRERKSNHGPLLTEHRPTFDICLTAPEYLTLKVDLRSRFEIRDRFSSQPYMRYRERLRLRTSWSITDFKISPYCSGEVFFSDKPKVDSNDLFDRTRLQVGFSFRPVPDHKNLTCTLYYMVQHNVSSAASDWDPINIWGVEFGCSF